MRTILFSVFLAVAACGGASKSDLEEPAGGAEPIAHEEEGHHGQHSEAEHPPLTPEMEAFHDVLKPLWHAEPGADRQTGTCAKAGELLGLSEKIQNAPNPGADQAAWELAVRQLMLSLVKLMDECKTGGDFEANFRAVHDGFHALLDLLPKSAS